MQLYKQMSKLNGSVCVKQKRNYTANASSPKHYQQPSVLHLLQACSCNPQYFVDIMKQEGFNYDRTGRFEIVMKVSKGYCPLEYNVI